MSATFQHHHRRERTMATQAETALPFGECDCCAAKNRALHYFCAAYSIETSACTDCTGADREADADAIDAEIERLCATADGVSNLDHLWALEDEHARLIARMAA